MAILLRRGFIPDPPGGGGTGTAPVIDSVVFGNNFDSQAASTTAQLSHTSSQFTVGAGNRVFVAMVAAVNKPGTGTPSAFSGVTGTNAGAYARRGSALTWTQASPNRGLNIGRMEVWWVNFNGALTNEDVTATCGSTVDYIGLLVLGFTGCNSPYWDPNVSLPATSAVDEGNNLVISGKSITNSGTLGLTFGLNNSNAGIQALATPSGWTVTNGPGQHDANGGFVYTGFWQAFTSPQTTTFNFTETSNTPPFGEQCGIMDALTS
jgi:hypothetical protein